MFDLLESLVMMLLVGMGCKKLDRLTCVVYFTYMYTIDEIDENKL